VLVPFTSRSAMAFPTNVEGRRVARTTRFIPQPASPSYARPVSGYGAASFVFLLRPASLASTPDWVRRLMRRSRCIVGASSARSLPPERAPSLHAHKGNWRGLLLSVNQLSVPLPRTRHSDHSVEPRASRAGSPICVEKLVGQFPCVVSAMGDGSSQNALVMRCCRPSKGRGVCGERMVLSGLQLCHRQ
jgi:hypothetical protein